MNKNENKSQRAHCYLDIMISVLFFSNFQFSYDPYYSAMRV